MQTEPIIRFLMSRKTEHEYKNNVQLFLCTLIDIDTIITTTINCMIASYNISMNLVDYKLLLSWQHSFYVGFPPDLFCPFFVN